MGSAPYASSSLNVCCYSSVGTKTNESITNNIGPDYMNLPPSLLVAEEDTAIQTPLKPFNTRVMLTQPIHHTSILLVSSHNSHTHKMSVSNCNSSNNYNNYSNSSNLLLDPVEWPTLPLPRVGPVFMISMPDSNRVQPLHTATGMVHHRHLD